MNVSEAGTGLLELAVLAVLAIFKKIYLVKHFSWSNIN